MSSSAILRPEILTIGNRCYRINPSSLPGLEATVDQQHQVYREEEEADYYADNLDDDEPSCKPQLKRTTIDSEESRPIGIIRFLFDRIVELSITRKRSRKLPHCTNCFNFKFLH